MQAQLHEVTDRPAKAVRLWRKSIRWAEQHRLIFDEAYSRWSYATHGSSNQDTRDQQLQLALGRFEELDCQYELTMRATDN